MLTQIRVAHARAARPIALSQRRLLATPPPSGVSPTGTPLRPAVVVTTTPGTTTVAAPIPPTASGTLPPPPPRGSLPPPPPPGGRKPRRFFRRFLIYTSLGLLTFYPLSGYLSTQYEGYRDFFVSTFPGAEIVADYADDNNWETLGVGHVGKRALQSMQGVKPDADKLGSTKEEAVAKFRELQRKAEGEGKKVEAKAESVVQKLEAKAQAAAEATKAKAVEVKNAVESKAHQVTLREHAAEAADKAKAVAEDVKSKAVGAASDVKAKAAGKASDAKAKVAGAEAKVKDEVDDVVSKAEKALAKGEAKVEHAAEKVKEKLEENPGPRGYLDAQRPRELRPETVTPKKPTYEGKEVYKGTLPVGHEPPPGYYIAPPVVSKVKEVEEKVKETLPLLAPKVKDFAASEPIITQLASTIDSLTSSLATPSSGDSAKILTKAQDDLTALSQRLIEVKKTEKEKLEKTVAEKAKEFETLLKGKEQERTKGEQGLKAEWEKEKSGMVSEWRQSLEQELESQRQGIEQRLREEVVSQGIELQRRWLRSIKTQVETERGGRLAKLDHLTTSLKQLERITLDNSATLDDNVRLHKVWSALRAVQAKAESGDVAFDDELRLLRSFSTPADKASPSETVVVATLDQLEKSGIAQTGVKSFAALASWFSNSVSPRVHSAALVPAPEEASVVSHLASATFSKLLFTPKAGVVEGDDVSSVLARAEWCLGEKDLDGAAREVNNLKGWPKKLAEDWLREARRRLEVQQALEVVGAEATLGSLLLV